jgi:hypothetical protein
LTFLLMILSFSFSFLSFFIFYFLFLFYLFSFIFSLNLKIFSCIFKDTKLTLINYLLKFHVLITTKCLGHYIEHIRFACIALGFSYHISVRMLCILRNHILFYPHIFPCCLEENFLQVFDEDDKKSMSGSCFSVLVIPNLSP